MHSKMLRKSTDSYTRTAVRENVLTLDQDDVRDPVSIYLRRLKIAQLEDHVSSEIVTSEVGVLELV